jgi:hypothetical protein
MDKQSPPVEWYTAKNDADWEGVCGLSTPDILPAAQGRTDAQHVSWTAAAILCFLAILGGWWWQRTQVGADQTEAELRATGQEDLEPAMHGEGWLSAMPDGARLGAARSLETPSFVFHYRQHDALAVMAAASQIEVLYSTLQRDFGLSPAPGAQKLAIEVRAMQTPEDKSPWLTAPDRIVVASPALPHASSEWAASEILAQSVALGLLAHVLAEAQEQHQIGPAWPPLLNGLQLWQVWEMGLPLSLWRDDIVRWLYVDLPAASDGQTVVLPDRYTALCAAHRLWMPSPTQIHIPLLCAEQGSEEIYWLTWGSRDPLMRLDQLTAPLHPGEPVEWSSRSETGYPGQAVALATLVEYAVITYGRERLPVLVAGMGQYESWETLLPAVFGVSSAALEAGWQAHLAAHYANE